MTVGGAAGAAGAAQWRRRRGLERRLHDGPALRLSALSLRLGVLRETVPVTTDAWRAGIAELQDEVATALQELREVAGEIYPSLLDEAGLGPALRELVSVTGARAHVDADGTRFGTAAEGAAYFAAAACLAACRSHARTVTVGVRAQDDTLVLTLTGVESAQADVVREEAVPLDGSVTVTESDQTATIIARFPCG